MYFMSFCTRPEGVEITGSGKSGDSVRPRALPVSRLWTTPGAGAAAAPRGRHRRQWVPGQGTAEGAPLTSAAVTARLLLVGGGRMGEALLGGLIAAGWAKPHELAVVEVVAERREVLRAQFAGVTVLDAVGPADAAVVAVKPNDVPAACEALAAAHVMRVLSIAAGVPTVRLEAGLAPGAAVVRAMPNTPALVGAGAAAIAGGSAASDADLAWAESILSAVGTVVRVDESLLDAVTGVSGSGPAYVFRFAEALIEAGVRAGLPREVSVALTEQTLTGSARLLASSDDPPEALRAAVTSPGGTTAAALAVLDEAGWFDAVVDAVAAATARSRELGAG